MDNFNTNFTGLVEGGELEPLHIYTAKTFLWMFLGLLLTFGISFAFYATKAVFALFYIPYIPFILLIAELGVVFYLSARIEKMAVGTARAMFFVYAALNGVVFSTYFILYEITSMIFVFAITAIYFGCMAAYGYFTKSDLSRIRPVLIGGLIFLIVFWVLSLFLDFTAFERIVCFIGVAIFIAFTAYDTQKIKAYYAAYSHDSEMAAKASIFSALQLYLDFVNLFVYILRILGRRK